MDELRFVQIRAAEVYVQNCKDFYTNIKLLTKTETRYLELLNTNLQGESNENK